jgi:flagellar hook-associated protein 1 FlgK
MSISSTLSNALSGLNVAARATDIVSSNIANAMTDGYGVRSLAVSARIIGNSGAGAWVSGVIRHEDSISIGHRRRAEAEGGLVMARSQHLARLEGAIGTPDTQGSLSARAAAFAAALTAAAAAPHDQMRLGGAVGAAVDLASTINTIAADIQDQRLQADGEIGRAVDQINTSLASLAALNTRIRQDAGGGRDVSALLDAQAQLVDGIAPLIPLEGRRDTMGALQLYSADGQALLDGRPAVLGLSAATVMSAAMSLADGSLSGLTLNGRALSFGGTAPAFGGGRLAGLVALRDQWAPAAQRDIDAVARDLAARFDAAGLDPTLAPGQPGLFTDATARVDPGAEAGLAARLRVNAAVLPAEGGAHWRLRDGLGATTPGASGAAEFLHAQIDALGALRSTASGGFSATGRSFAGLVGDHLTGVGQARQAAEVDLAHGAARLNALRDEVLGQGVDTDAELQRLLRIEQIFAANARVVSTAQDMIDELIRMGR